MTEKPVRDHDVVRNKHAYLAIGVNGDGEREVLGIWIEQTEGAKFWLQILTELKQRGVQDVLVCCVAEFRITCSGWAFAPGLACDDRDREAVVALAADGLDRGRVDQTPTHPGGELLVEQAYAADALVAKRRIVGVGVEDRAAADDVVDDDQGAGPRQL